MANANHPQPRDRLNRRAFLASASALAFVSAAGLKVSPAFAAPDETAFHAFSEFITGETLDPVLAGRYLKALTRKTPEFGTDIDQAIAATAAFRDQGIDKMLEALGPDSPVRKTITAVTSAWYLGVVGTDIHGELVAFHDALMFRPTRDYVFVPTYGGGPNSWVSRTHV